MIRTVGLAAAVGLVLLVPACTPIKDKPCHPGTGFAASFVAGYVGAATPETAGQRFARHPLPEFKAPLTGWHIVGQDTLGTFVRAGSIRLHTIYLDNGTWAVDSGTKCG